MNIKVVAALALSVLLVGCASPARVTQMTITSEDAKQHRMSSTALEQQISVKESSGGTETNPLWTSEIGDKEFTQALKDSLLATNLLAADQGQYALTATLKKVDQPIMGLNLTVTTTIEYALVRNTDGTVIYKEDIITPYTATMGQAFAAVKRLQMANEGSARTNINKLIEKLHELKIDANAVSLAQ